MDVRRALQRNPGVGLTEFEAELVVHEVVRHPEGHFGDPGRKLADLDPVELVHIEPGQRTHVESGRDRARLLVPFVFENRPDHFQFQAPQFTVGDHQEVAAAAGRIEERQLAEPLLERPEPRQAPTAERLDLGELLPEVVEEERLDDLRGCSARSCSAHPAPGAAPGPSPTGRAIRRSPARCSTS